MEVKQLIKNTWNSVPHLHVEERLSLCRRAICKWSKEFYENSRKTIESLRNQLKEAMTEIISNEELIYQINSDLLQTYKKEEAFWTQKSRQLWLTLGDSNTSYFHATTKARQARNRLSVIEDGEGIPVYEEEQIAAVICNFYSNLFTSFGQDGTHIVNLALKPCISLQTNEELIRMHLLWK